MFPTHSHARGSLPVHLQLMTGHRGADRVNQHDYSEWMMVMSLPLTWSVLLNGTEWDIGSDIGAGSC